MRFIKRIALIMAGISALYIISSAALSFTELSFRTWVDVLGRMITGIFLPIMLLAWALTVMYQSAHIRAGLKAVCITAAAIVCSVYVFWLFFFILLGMEEERKLTSHLLVTDESFLSETDPVYYRPTAFLLKKPGEITTTDRVEFFVLKLLVNLDYLFRSSYMSV